MKKRFKKVIPFIFAATLCLFLGGLRVCADKTIQIPLTVDEGGPVTVTVKKIPGDYAQTTFTLNSQYELRKLEYRVSMSSMERPEYLESAIEKVFPTVMPGQFGAASKTCTAFLLRLALLPGEQEAVEAFQDLRSLGDLTIYDLFHYARSYMDVDPLTELDVRCAKHAQKGKVLQQRIDEEKGKIDEQKRLEDQRREEYQRRITAMQACLSTSPLPGAALPAPAAAAVPCPVPARDDMLRLHQTNGDLVTVVGQKVSFVGTNEFAGEGIPADPMKMDEWMVMKIERNRALIMKRHPIAIQTYGKKPEPGKVKYNDSAIKVSVDAWWDYVKGVPFPGGKAAQDYVLPVTLDGADQCEPCDYSKSDQGQYRTKVDLDCGKKQAFVPSLADVTAGGNLHQVAVDPRRWSKFVSPVSGDSASYSWLRSPLHPPNFAALIHPDGTPCDYRDHPNDCGVRPACWVRI